MKSLILMIKRLWYLIRYGIKVPPFLEQGQLLPNGSWTGVLGMLQRKVSIFIS